MKNRKSQIIHLVSENEVHKDTIHGLKIRSLDHKFCYIGDIGVKNWLNMLHDPEYQNKFESNTQTIFREKIDDIIALLSSKEINLISMGPGDGENESYIIKRMLDKGIKVYYYPVEFSIEMLKLAISKVEDIDCITVGLHVDLNTENFTDYLSEKIRSTNRKNLFVMLGNTFGNFNDQYGILDTLYNVIHSQDLLLLDVVIKDHKTKLDYMQDFDYKMRTVNDKNRTNFYASHLMGGLNFKTDFGHPEVRVYSPDMNNNILKREHYFVFDRNVVLEIKDEKVIFSKGEKIKVHDVCWYEEKYFQKFLEGHGFKIVKKYIEDSSGFFLVKIR